MDERNSKLVKNFGPRFIARGNHISNECLYLAADACSVMTDEEWNACAKAMTNFLDKLNEVKKLVNSRINEVVSGDDDKYMELYGQAKESLNKFSTY